MNLETLLPTLLGLAWLLPLASFTAILFFGPKMGKAGRCAGYLATSAIVCGFLCSAVATIAWITQYPVVAVHHGDAQHATADAEHGESHDGHAAAEEADGEEHQADHGATPVSGQWYTLGQFGALTIGIGYYIDALTLAAFCMVTLIASCIHIYSFGYMHEELEDVTDPLVTTSQGEPLTRPGRFHRFYQYLSLFCFSMLGLLVAGNIAMVFVFWELVGICSYLLIGFYIERKSASNAANKAFIVNRVGDFGMIIGLMVIWAGIGSFGFADIFEAVRPAEHHHELVVPDGMVRLAAADEVEAIYLAASDTATAEANVEARIPEWRNQGMGYWLLIVAGLGIFCGCVGKSAQFPLHVWLPDAMEGPTPVSALIHAATMVAAGVYLVGRFYPVFTPEVLLVIAYVGTITLFMAATIAIVATDIKRVLAYSTVSQLGYMMLALGVGGWVAGLFHLFTHAFFKALLFLCSGSVIHACHTNEMPEMGGLWKKMPWTAWTMLVGCLAISGAGIPFILGLSGYYSKDSILAQAFSFSKLTPVHGWVFYAAAGGAAITAFYMFRLWFLTFAGKPRNEHVYDHAHESPKTMYVPLVVLATLAVVVGWPVPLTEISVVNLLEQARPAGTGVDNAQGQLLTSVAVPAEHLSHASSIHIPVTLIAFTTALIGILVAAIFYLWRHLDAEKVRRLLSPLHGFLARKWFFDELYHVVFVLPAYALARLAASLDRNLIDALAHGAARTAVVFSYLDDLIDRHVVDGLVNGTATAFHDLGVRLRSVQTGQIRQYVTMLAVGTVVLFVIFSLLWGFSAAGDWPGTAHNVSLHR